jgi:CRISPR/Cas system CMR-associated protein Cmr3 (group 5 of RAMP superfamily)
MPNTPKHSPAPWTASRGQITDANGVVLGSFLFHGDEVDLVNGDLMAAAPDLLESLQKTEELMKLNIKTLTAMIRHEMHAADTMISLSDLTDKLSAQFKEIRDLTSPFKEQAK